MSEQFSIIKRLQVAIDHCCKRFNSQNYLASDQHAEAVSVCQQFEAFFLHGLLNSPSSSSLSSLNNNILRMCKKVSHTILYGGSIDNNTTYQSVVWHLIQRYLSMDELRSFYQLEHVYTDIGRFRAWIRWVLNNQYSERYLMKIGADNRLLAQYYEPWAAIRNSQNCIHLLKLLSSLKLCIFSLTIDRPDLNKYIFANDLPCVNVSSAYNISSPTNILTEPEAVLSSSLSDGVIRTSAIANDEHHPEEHTRDYLPDINNNPSNSASLETALSTCSSEDPLAVCDDIPDKNPTNVHDTPPYMIIENIEVCSNKSILLDKNLNSHEFSVSSTYCQPEISTNSDICLSPEFCSQENKISNLDLVDMNANICLKDQLDQNVSVECNMEEKNDTETDFQFKSNEITRENNLLSDLIIENKRKFDSELTKYKSKIDFLQSENDILKEQMRQHVSTMQQLRLENESCRSDSISSQHTHYDPASAEYVYSDYFHECEAYRHKLAQVADMYGDLMELNSRLREQLRTKENMLSTMQSTGQNTAAFDPKHGNESSRNTLLSSTDLCDSHCHLFNSSSTVVLIPSVVLSQFANKSFYSYQIYIRMLREEWNLNRRYSHFRILYKLLSKSYSKVRKFRFPEKVFNNTSAKLIETRRLRLQEFLRCVIDCLFDAHDQLRNAPCLSTLVKIEPFFEPDCLGALFTNIANGQTPDTITDTDGSSIAESN